MSRSTWVVALVVALAPMGACNRSGPADEAPPAFTMPGARAGLSDSSTVHLRFTEIAQDVGVRFVHENGAFGEKWMPETMGSGGGFLDWDSDGLPDIILVNGTSWPGHEGGRGRATARLFRNLGDGGFEDRTPPGLDVPIYGMGATFADYDGDGDPDVYLTAVGTNRLLRNDGDRFTDVAVALGVTGNSDAPGDPPAWSTAATWFDVDLSLNLVSGTGTGRLFIVSNLDLGGSTTDDSVEADPSGLPIVQSGGGFEATLPDTTLIQPGMRLRAEAVLDAHSSQSLKDIQSVVGLVVEGRVGA